MYSNVYPSPYILKAKESPFLSLFTWLNLIHLSLVHMYDRKSDMSFYLLDFYEPYKVPIVTKSASWRCGFVSASAFY